MDALCALDCHAGEGNDQVEIEESRMKWPMYTGNAGTALDLLSQGPPYCLFQDILQAIIWRMVKAPGPADVCGPASYPDRTGHPGRGSRPILFGRAFR